MRTLATAAALLVAFAAVLYALAPNLNALDRFALQQQEQGDTARTFALPGTLGLDQVLYIPTAGALSGIEIGSNKPDIEGVRRPSGFGFGSDAFLLPVGLGGEPPIRIQQSEDHGRIGISRVFLAPVALATEAATAQSEWAWRNQVLSMPVAVVAALVLLLLIGSASPSFAPAPLAALAYLVLAQALARERDIGTFLGHHLDGAEYLLAIWVAYALATAANTVAEKRRFGGAALILLTVSSVLVFFAGPGSPPVVMSAPAAIAAPLVAIGFIRTLYAANEPEFSPLSLAAMLLALTASAFSLIRAATPSLFNEAFALATLHALGSLPLLVLGTVQLCTGSFTARREAVAKLKADLAAQAAELGGVRASLQEEARMRMLSDERSRIMRDMHDGIGGRLLSLLIRVRAGRLDIASVEREVQESLNDLRLIVDSLDSAGESLGAALTAFRARAERQLEGAGMTLDWHEDAETLDAISFEPQATLDIFRILQEAVANAIGHAGAAKVSIAIARENGALAIEIADDGRGLAPDAANGRGKGLKNMAARAARLGAELTTGSNGGKGHRIAIAVPLNRPGQSPEGSSSQPS